MQSPELDEKLKQAELARMQAEEAQLAAQTELAKAQATHLKGQKWWASPSGNALISAIASVLVAYVSTQATIHASKNELNDLIKQIEAQRERADEAIVRDFWVAHVLRSLEGIVPSVTNRDAYITYIHLNYETLLREYKSLGSEKQRRIEEKSKGVAKGP
jgi:hypothetical protein